MVREEEPDQIEYDSMEEVVDSYSSSREEVRLSEWEENPEPTVGKPDGQTITENKRNQDYAYVWHAKNSDAWIRFEGETLEVET